MKLIRILIGLPIVIIATFLPYATILPTFFYFVGCFVGLVGGYFLTRIFKYDNDEIFWVLMGIPMYFFAMHPHSFVWLAEFGVGGFEEMVARWVACLLSLCFIFASINID